MTEVETLCTNCKEPTNGVDMCIDCVEYFEELDYGYNEEDEEYENFDCTCGAWQFSHGTGKPIHIADCICGSSEPW